MNKTWAGVIGAVLVIVLLVWLLGGSRISCRESFWDKNKQVIEIQRD
jgi:CDP-diglyceride synthetase